MFKKQSQLRVHLRTYAKKDLKHGGVIADEKISEVPKFEVPSNVTLKTYLRKTKIKREKDEEITIKEEPLY